MSIIYRQLLQAVQTRTPAVLVTAMTGPAAGQKLVVTEEGVTGSLGPLTQPAQEHAALALRTGKGGPLSVGESRLLLEPYMPPPEVIIFGAGHIGQALAKFARILDYRITVIDDRPAFANTTLFPQADAVICDEFAQALTGVRVGPHSSVIIVTRGHKHDEVVLRQVLATSAGYIGMIGSRRRVGAVMDEMEAQGLLDAAQKRVHAPIGLDIGAETPEEIALSIMAEVTRVRRGGSGQSLLELQRGSVRPGADRVSFGAIAGGLKTQEMLSQVVAALERGLPVAMTTIATTKGATPRRPGAKMLVFADGQMMGTVGGGCGESEVRQEALERLGDGRASVYSVDLTEDVARTEREICGGIMEVFIDPLLPA